MSLNENSNTFIFFGDGPLSSSIVQVWTYKIVLLTLSVKLIFFGIAPGRSFDLFRHICLERKTVNNYNIEDLLIK